jgi:exonuclease III
MIKTRKRTLRLLMSMMVSFPVIVVLFASAMYFLTPFASFQFIISKSVLAIWLYFLAAIILLIRSKRYWMFLCFGCCAALCLFMKNSTNKAFAYAEKTEGIAFKIANFNATSDVDYADFQRVIKNNDADLLCIQEVSDSLNIFLTDSLKKQYPFFSSIKRKDFYGMMVFSKFPFGKIDTVFYQNIPNLVGCINIDKEKCKLNFVSSYLLPAYNATSYEQMRGHLGNIATKVLEINQPTIAIGTYSTVPWAPEIIDFKALGKLTDSRLGITPNTPKQITSILSSSYHHIFHTKNIQCVDFHSIVTNGSTETGIIGTYQFISEND